MLAAIEVACVLLHNTHGKDTALVPINAFNNCQSLLSTMSATGVVKSKNVDAAVAALREIWQGGAMSSLTWVPAAGQTADCLTKERSAAAPRTTLLTGQYGLWPRGITAKTFETDRSKLDAPTRARAVD